ncbi:MAG: hypothetical protein ABI954_01370 [Pyrinomonadaceae bacterium]
MRSTIFSFLFVILATSFAFAQNGVPAAALVKSPSQTTDLAKSFDDFSLDLPNETWHVTNKTANAEMVYGTRLDGYLQIRKVAVDEGAALADVIDREINQKLQFKPGFVNGKEESFKGNLSGKVANYEYTESGKAMIGRVYFLQADNKTFYVLKFTGLRDKLRSLRNQTDSIARSFELKK